MNNITNIDFVRKCIPERKIDANKADNGKVLCIAGSSGMCGAGILASRAALRTGSGLVYLSVPNTLQNIVNIATPEVITLGDLSISQIKKMDIDAIAIGPGIGLKRKEFVRNLIKCDIEIPLVIDADGLNSIADNPEILKKRKYPTIITPHPGEMSRLIRLPIEKIKKSRAEMAVEFAKKWKIILVLKGYNTVVAAPDGDNLINKTGNAGMATAGMGDVLTGMILSLIGQGIKPYEACVCAVFIHGLAGDLCSKLKGQYGIIASDVIDAIPYIIKSLRDTLHASRDT